MAVNTVALSGNLASDAELRTTKAGSAVLSFTICVNERQKQGNEWVSRPNFFRCIMFGAYAEVMASHMLKGTKAAVEGRLRQNTWEQDGQKRSSVEVIVNQVELMSGQQTLQGAKSASKPSQAQSRTSTQTKMPQSVYDDDIPF